MKKSLLAIALATVVFAPSTGSAHPPAFDPQNNCLLPIGGPGAPGTPIPVLGTLSYLAPLGTSIPACLAPPPSPPLAPGLPPYVAEWGSHAPACPPLPFVGSIPGAYCGPLVPPFGTGTCTWRPIINTVPTRLVIGFDINNNGAVTLPPEAYVAGTFAPGSWTVPNLYTVPPQPARVIGYPTNVGPFPPGATPALDVNLVVCVTP